MAYTFFTKQSSEAMKTIPIDEQVTGRALAVEFSKRGDFSSIVSTKHVTGSGNGVNLSLSSAEVDIIGDSYYRVKAVGGPNAKYLQSGYIEQIPLEISAGSVSGMTCPTCGAFIRSSQTEIHDDWHRYDEPTIVTAYGDWEGDPDKIALKGGTYYDAGPYVGPWFNEDGFGGQIPAPNEAVIPDDAYGLYYYVITPEGWHDQAPTYYSMSATLRNDDGTWQKSTGLFGQGGEYTATSPMPAGAHLFVLWSAMEDWYAVPSVQPQALYPPEFVSA